MQFTDQEHDKVTLDYRTEHDEPTGEHVLMITRMDDQFLLTNHRQRGIEFPGGKGKLANPRKTRWNVNYLKRQVAR